MSDKDLRSQLEGLFSDIAPEPEAKKEETVVEPLEAKAESEPVAAEPKVKALPLTPAEPEEAEWEKREVPPPSVLAWETTLKEQRLRILNILLGSITVTGVVAVGGLLIGLAQRPSRLVAYIPYFAAYMVLVSVTLARRLDPRLRATILVMLAYIVGIFSLLRNGPLGTGGLYLLIAPLLCSILIRQRVGAAAAAASIVLYIAFVFAHHQGWLQPAAVYDLAQLYFMLNLSGTFAMIVASVMFTQWMFNYSLTGALREARGKHKEVFRSQTLLEDRANELATANALLRKLTLQLQTAAQVSHAATSVLDPDELMRQAVTLIRNRFGFYYVGLFLLDEAKRWATLRAGTGEAGRQMLEAGHKLQVGGESMVGWCTAYGQASIALNVSEAMRFDNPLLPETRSEVALPLISRGQVIGALDVQSTEVAAFSNEDIAALQTMADQLAVAIDNARLFREVQASLEETQTIHRHYLREAWEGFTSLPEARLGYRHTEPEATSSEEVWLSTMTEAVQQGDAATAADGEEGVELAVPITLRGQTIGALGLRREGASGWTADDVTVVQAVAEQVALSLENMRLFEEARRRARRERIIREITTKMRDSTDLDTILQTTLQELAKVLGTSRTFVQLGANLQSTGREGKRGAPPSALLNGNEFETRETLSNQHKEMI